MTNIGKTRKSAVFAPDLFLGLDIKWPPEFKEVCRDVASFFNFNISALVKALQSWFHLQIPNPLCLILLEYSLKWDLIMATPFMLPVVVLGYQLVSVIRNALGIILKIVLNNVWEDRHDIWEKCVSCCDLSKWHRPSDLVESSRNALRHCCCCTAGLARRSDSERDLTSELLPESCMVDSVQEGNARAQSNREDHTISESSEALSVSRAASPDLVAVASRPASPQLDLPETSRPVSSQLDLSRRVQGGSDSIGTGLSRPVTPEQPDDRPVAAAPAGRSRSTPEPEPEPELELEPEPEPEQTSRQTISQGLSKLQLPDWEDVAQSITKMVLAYLMVGYIFLASTAMEPLSCDEKQNGRLYMHTAPDIECHPCDQSDDGNLRYKPMMVKAYIFATVYGLGTPALFFGVLYTYKDELKKNSFMSSFGFLSTKMREEFYTWEVIISFRKLLLVVGTKFSNNHVVVSTLWNAFVVVLAFGLQVWAWPFANDDANWAELLTLLSTMLVLILGMAQWNTSDSDVVGVSVDADSATPQPWTVLDYFKMAIYFVMGFFVVTTVMILTRRINGVWYNMKHRNDFETKEIKFRQPSYMTWLRIMSVQRMWRCRSFITREKVKDWVHIEVWNRQLGEQEGKPYMATQHAIAYTHEDCKVQQALIYQGQIINVVDRKEVETSNLEVGVTATRVVMRCELGWVRKKAKGHCTVKADGHCDTSDFNTLFIGESETKSGHVRYYEQRRQSSIGRHFEVARCKIPAFKPALKKHDDISKALRVGDDEGKAKKFRQRVAMQAELDGFKDKLGPILEYLQTGVNLVNPDDPFDDDYDPIAGLSDQEQEALETAISLASRPRRRKSDYQLQCGDVVEVVGGSPEDKAIYDLFTERAAQAGSASSGMLNRAGVRRLSIELGCWGAAAEAAQKVVVYAQLIGDADDEAKAEAALAREINENECAGAMALMDPDGNGINAEVFVQWYSQRRTDAQLRLQVVDPLRPGAAIGWISKQKERTLHDEVRKVLHKSKLNVATAWALANAEGEDFRRMEQVFQEIEHFRERMKIVQDKKWHKHFPAKLRPAIYAWIASADKRQTQSLQWFMTELKLAEEEQMRVLPHWWKVEKEIRKQIKCLDEKEDVRSTRTTQSFRMPMNARGSMMNPHLMSGRMSPPPSGRTSSMELAEAGGHVGDSSTSESESDGEENDLRDSRVITANPSDPDGVGSASCSIRLRIFWEVLTDTLFKGRLRSIFTVVVLIVWYAGTLWSLTEYEMLRQEVSDPTGGCPLTVCTVCELHGGVAPPGVPPKGCAKSEGSGAELFDCINHEYKSMVRSVTNVTGTILKPRSFLFGMFPDVEPTHLEFIYLFELWVLWVFISVGCMWVVLTKTAAQSDQHSCRQRWTQHCLANKSRNKVAVVLAVWALLCTGGAHLWAAQKRDGQDLVSDARYVGATFCGPVGILLGELVYVGFLWDPPHQKVEAIQKAEKEHWVDQGRGSELQVQDLAQ